MLRVITSSLLILVTACASVTPPDRPVGHQPREESAVLAALDAYMLAISANDLAAMDARQMPEGMTYRHVPSEGGWAVSARSNKEWVAPERATSKRLRERYWSPTVLIRGSMALVWAPYEFHVDGATSHCGVDSFSFARIGDEWKVSNAMWTVEPNACGELRPRDPSTLRPAGSP
jgi:hypothetical protein